MRPQTTQNFDKLWGKITYSIFIQTINEFSTCAFSTHNMTPKLWQASL